MSRKIAIEALRIFFSRNTPKRHVRLFGGEPLLKFDLVKAIVNFSKRQASGPVTFDITTNGLALTDRMIDFFRNNPEIEVIISLDGDRISQRLNRNSRGKNLDSYFSIIKQKDSILKLPKPTINMVIAPNQVGNLFRNFIHILNIGFKRFNFLPAYFVYWGKRDLLMLKNQFRKISCFIAKQDDHLSIKNLEVNGETALFNDGFVVDCNGDIFTSNVVLSRYFSYLRPRLIVGNVMDNPGRDIFEYEPADINYLIRRSINLELLESTCSVDAILTTFVNSLYNETDRH